MLSALAARFIIVPAAVFAGIIGLICLHPYNGGDLRAFLTSDDCLMPCFIGIRPGVTTGGEAFRLLDNHAWIGDIDLYVDLNTLAWEWSGAQPAWIDAGERGMLFLDGRGVQYLRVRTTIPFGDVWLALGKPEFNAVRPPALANVRRMEHSASYFGDTFRAVRAAVPCAIRLDDYWRGFVTIALFNRDEIERGAPESRRVFDLYQRPYC